MAGEAATPILVVDDYPMMLRIMRDLLRQAGFSNVEDAADGAAALVKLREKRYALVVSDWNMEPMNGLELLAEMRADESLKDTPFIMVTAESKSDRVLAAKQAGVDNYIVKPFNATTLRAKINAVMGEQAA